MNFRRDMRLLHIYNMENNAPVLRPRYIEGLGKRTMRLLAVE